MPRPTTDWEVLTEEFAELMTRAVQELRIKEENISDLKSVKRIKLGDSQWHACGWIVLSGMILLAFILFPTIFYLTMINKFPLTHRILDAYLHMRYDAILVDETCIIPMTESMQDPFRPPIDCSECVGITGPHRVRNLSQEEFMERYATTMQPVVVEDGQNGWSAGESFSFEFFRKLYSEGSESLSKASGCQFFRYQTEFRGLGEMLNMSKARAQGSEKPWYVGWSNCDGKVANILRKHYTFPYFLPMHLDHSKTDWIFMGLPGYGADMHIDGVDAVSWQAQIKGIKKWILESPPECSGICIHSMEIIVHPGDIIVLDTNKWFHATLIMGNETSIVIGSEYY